MNREKFFRNLVIAVALVMVAGLAGQLRRMDRERSAFFSTHTRSSRSAHVRVGSRLPRFEAGVLVRFKEGVSPEFVRAVTETFNDRVEDRYESVEGLTAIRDLDGAGAEAVVKQYESLSDLVEYAEPEMVLGDNPPGGGAIAPERSEAAAHANRLLSTQPNDPMFADQWALANTGQREGQAGGDIRALKAWSRTKGSEKLVVAVLDSGVEYTHADLSTNMWVRPAAIPEYEDRELGVIDDIYGYDAEENDGDPMDENGHGTHCAGIVGAVGDNRVGVAGVNWRVQIMPLKFMGKNGFGTTKNAIEAINYVVDRKKAGVPVSIISASWGSTLYSRALKDAIARAGDAGILFIAAAGNASANADRAKHYPASYDLPNVLSVAALNRRDELASFSNYGAKTVHVAAPGAEIVSTWLGDSYFEASGTSMATPAVAGIAALVLAVNPNMTVADLRARLIESADPIASLNGKVVSGGRINAARAVEAE